jgi:CubicO group peptidase (beta-lactamase class C family)
LKVWPVPEPGRVKKGSLVHRRQFLRQMSAGLAAALSPGAVFQAPAVVDRRVEIGGLMTRLHELQLFTGELLVAEKGSVIYEGAFGTADHRTGRPYTVDTRSCLASLSKPITAVAIMMVAEKRLLAYDDPLSKFLPGFTGSVGAVTLRHLLTHTSGIPDYPDLNVDRPGVTNAEILTALRKVPNPSFPPGQKYQYSNSGYVLLALILEASSGESLPRFLDSRIFKPLGMSATFVLTNPAQKTADVARGYGRTGAADDFEGMATGESGVYSTVPDLLRFDQALYTDRLVSQRALAEAFVPAAVREGSSTYGFGWNIVTDASGTRVWHQGNTAGFRAFIERRLRDRITVIMLTNGGDTNRMAINDNIQRILRGEAPQLPPPR